MYGLATTLAGPVALLARGPLRRQLAERVIGDNPSDDPPERMDPALVYPAGSVR